MGLKETIKSLLQQGSLYRSQGLLNEAKGKYEQALALIEKNPKIKNRDTILKGIRSKIKAVDADIENVDSAEETPEIPEQIQDLIKQQFAFSEDKDMGELEGALALAKFGQFQRALTEFEGLIGRKKIAVDAAKNVIRCHIALASLEDAVSSYNQWLSEDTFDPQQIAKIRVFLEATLAKEGAEQTLPKNKEELATGVTSEPASAIGEASIEMPDLELGETAPEIDVPDIEIPKMEEDEILDINSIGIQMEIAKGRTEVKELNVSFQSGNVVSLLIPSRDKAIIDFLTIDKRLEDAQFFSPIAIFNGTGLVVAKNQISSGPRRGDFSVDIKVITA